MLNCFRMRVSVFSAALTILILEGLTVNAAVSALDEAGVRSNEVMGTPEAIYWEPGQADEPVLLPLPDEGPRYEQSVEGPGSDLFLKGVAAYRQHDLQTAAIAFREVIQQHPNAALVPAVRAFLIELTLLRDSRLQQRLIAIEAYRALANEFPHTPNGSRAYWRLADLYADLQMRLEAQGAYERAAMEATNEADRGRAVLGMAVNALQWKHLEDAETFFQWLLEQKEQDFLIRQATIGLAETLYALRRFKDAEFMYHSAYSRWPEIFKERPRLLYKYADTLFLLQDDARARQLYTLVYNLHPTSREAQLALVRIGDTFRRVHFHQQAAFFYAAALSRYEATVGGAIARMRLAELGQELLALMKGGARLPTEFGGSPLPLSLFSGQPGPVLDLTRQQRIFQEVARAYEDSSVGSEALFHLGEHFEQVQNRNEAVRAYRQVVERNGRVPKDPWPARARHRLSALLTSWIAEALRRGDDLQAISLYRESRELVEASLANNGLRLALAKVLREMGITGEAINLFQEILRDRAELTSFREEALLGLGQAYMDQDDFGSARRVFERYRIEYPIGRWTSEALLSLARAYRGLNDRPGMIRVYRQWLKLVPPSSSSTRGKVLMELARALAESGELERAVRIYRVAEREGAITDARVLIQFAELLSRVGRHAEAAQRYEKAVRASRQDGESEWALLQLGLMKRAQKRYADARARFQQLARQDSDGLLGRVAVAMLADLPAQ